jgi:hypothetical protein
MLKLFAVESLARRQCCSKPCSLFCTEPCRLFCTKPYGPYKALRYRLSSWGWIALRTCNPNTQSQHLCHWRPTLPSLLPKQRHTKLVTAGQNSVHWLISIAVLGDLEPSRLAPSTHRYSHHNSLANNFTTTTPNWETPGLKWSHWLALSFSTSGVSRSL